MTEPRTPAILYGAKSTEDKHDSIPDQLADARAMAAENGWEVVGSYSDANFSAYSGNRGRGLIDAEAHAARAAAERGTVAMLITQAHDRFARGAGDQPGAPDSLGEVWHRCRRKNVWLRSAEDDEELRDEASVAAVGRRAHIDSKRKGKSVAKGARRRKARGMHNGGPRKFGYDYARHPDGSTIPGAPMRVDRTESVIYLDLIYPAALAGASDARIARDLEDDRVPTTRGQTRWHKSSVRNIVIDPFYCGKLRGPDGDLLDGQQPALITVEQWEQLQTVRASQSYHRQGGRNTGNPALFTNRHLRCGECGGTMGYRSKPNRTGGRWERYACCERERDVRACGQTPVDVAPLEQAALRALLRESATATDEASRQLSGYRADVDLTRARLADAERLGLQNVERTKRAETEWLDGAISSALYEKATARLDAERAAAEAETEQLARHLAELEERASDVDTRQVMMQAMGSLTESLSAALAGTGDLDRARARLRAAFPVITLRTADSRMWLDLGAPEPSWVRAHLDDELGAGHAGEPVLGGSAITDQIGLPISPVIAEVGSE